MFEFETHWYETLLKEGEGQGGDEVGRDDWADDEEVPPPFFRLQISFQLKFGLF